MQFYSINVEPDELKNMNGHNISLKVSSWRRYSVMRWFKGDGIEGDKREFSPKILLWHPKHNVVRYLF